MSEPSSAKANRKAEEAQALKERRRYNAIVITVVVVLALLVVFAVLFSSNLFYNTTTAVSVGGYDFSAADFNFNYFTAYNTHYNTYAYYAQLGMTGVLPVSGTPLDEQACGLLDDGGTWADYFEQQALASMRQIAMLCTAAENDSGFTLSQEDKDTVDETVEGMRDTAKTYGYPDLESYLTQLYGKGMTEKVFRENLLRQATASAYAAYKQESFTYTADEIAAKYAEQANDLDFYTMRSYWFSGAAVSDDTSTEEDETLSAEDAMAKAEADAKAFDAAVSDEQSFMDYAASLHEDDEDYDADESTFVRKQGSDVSADMIKAAYDWLTDSARKAGDHTVVGSTDEDSRSGFYVLYFLERDNNQYASVNGQYGYIPENTDVFEEGAEPEDEDEKAAQIKLVNLQYAHEVLASYTNGTEKSADAFAAVMSGEENSDLVTNSGAVDRGGRYDMPEELSDWFYDASRQEGDTEAIYVEGDGTYIVYYTGTGDIYANVLADTILRSADASSWAEEQLKAFTVDTQWEMTLTKKMASLN